MDSVRATPKGGLPHSDIRGSKGARPSPRLFAACHVLLRLLVPRHPLNALLTLTISSLSPCAGRSRLTELCTHHARLKHSPPRLPRTVRPRRSPGGTLHQTLFICQRTFLRPIPRTAPHTRVRSSEIDQTFPDERRSLCLPSGAGRGLRPLGSPHRRRAPSAPRPAQAGRSLCLPSGAGRALRALGSRHLARAPSAPRPACAGRLG